MKQLTSLRWTFPVVFCLSFFRSRHFCILKNNYFTITTRQRVRNPVRSNPASHANINFFSRHPAMLSSCTQVIRRCLSFESLSSSCSNESACQQDMFPMDLIVDNSAEDIRVTRVSNRVRRGLVVLPYLSSPSESLYVRRRKGIAQRIKSRPMNLTPGARQENSRMIVEPGRRLDCILFISFLSLLKGTKSRSSG